LAEDSDVILAGMPALPDYFTTQRRVSCGKARGKGRSAVAKGPTTFLRDRMSTDHKPPRFRRDLFGPSTATGTDRGLYMKSIMVSRKTLGEMPTQPFDSGCSLIASTGDTSGHTASLLALAPSCTVNRRMHSGMVGFEPCSRLKALWNGSAQRSRDFGATYPLDRFRV
jgi:hypothetical protein